MTIQFINRYGDGILFMKDTDWEIKMIGGEYFRYGWKTDDQRDKQNYTMVDPSGGPYIASGSDMGRFDKAWKGLIVSHINVIPESDIKTLHLFQGRMMKGTTNGEEELRWYKAGDSSGDFKAYNDMEQFLVAQNGNQ